MTSTCSREGTQYRHFFARPGDQMTGILDTFDETDWQNLARLARDGSLDEVLNYLLRFDSYALTEPMTYMMIFAPPRRCLQIFLEVGNDCDAPWPYRSRIAKALRCSIAQVPLIELLEPEARDFYVALPDPVQIWRGCERGRERGLHWTMRRALAEAFAHGKRCRNANPTFVSAEIPKRHILGVFVSRNEDEVVVDPRRLRKLRKLTIASPSVEEQTGLTAGLAGNG
jgi:hypothetical protein